MKKNEEIYNCSLRKKKIDVGKCFETVMVIWGMHSIELKNKIWKVTHYIMHDKEKGFTDNNIDVVTGELLLNFKRIRYTIFG